MANQDGADLRTNYDAANHALERNLRWVATADAKLPAIFAIDTAMSAALAALVPKVNGWSQFTMLVSFGAAVGLLVSVIFLALAAFPRLAGPKESMVYFGGIVSMSEVNYIKRATAGITKELLEDVARQAYRNAEIAHQKYRWLRGAMIAMFLSMLPWLVAISLLYANKTTP